MTQSDPLMSGQDDRDGSGAGRDRRLSWFASGGGYDKAVPDAGMADALEAVTDASGRPPLAA